MVKSVTSRKKRVKLAYKAVQTRIKWCCFAVIESDAGDEVYTVPPHNHPLVAIDNQSLKRLRAFAKRESEESGRTVSIICFTMRRLRETVSPSTTGGEV